MPARQLEWLSFCKAGIMPAYRHGGRREAWRTTRGMADDARRKRDRRDPTRTPYPELNQESQR